MLRIQKVPELTPLPFTVLGWNVPDIRARLLISQATASSLSAITE
jgi:hypothetical protein